MIFYILVTFRKQLRTRWTVNGEHINLILNGVVEMGVKSKISKLKRSELSKNEGLV